jgi:PAB-dependent poly(A)-specific ribonuclease subunit 3
MNEMAMSTIENWRRIRHANVVSVREAFTTKAFGDHCKLVDEETEV